MSSTMGPDLVCDQPAKVGPQGGDECTGRTETKDDSTVVTGRKVNHGRWEIYVGVDMAVMY